MPRSILVAGASGALGREVVSLLLARGDRVRSLVRHASRAPAGTEVAVADSRDLVALAPHLEGVDAVFSCLGASVLPTPGHGWRGFHAVDFALNRNLIAAATAAGVGRFTYVSVFHSEATRGIAYVDAHEKVVDVLRQSPLSWSVVRPSGFFSAIGSFLDMARRGRMPLLGRPDARANPIHDRDLAEIRVAALDGGEQEVDAGGPDVITRREMGELAFAALSLPPRFVRLPSWLVRAGAAVARPFHPRIAQAMGFFARLGEIDLVAPQRGRRRLRDYFAEAARG